MKISILMPTRSGVGNPSRALHSIVSTASDPSKIEVLLRMDEDDEERLKDRFLLETNFGAKCVVGPHHNGYTSMGKFVDDLLHVCTGDLVWLFDDDAWVEGYNWQSQLDMLATSKCAIQPDTYKLGESIYPKGCGPVSLIVPTDFAKMCMPTQSVVDQQWDDELTRLRVPRKHLFGVTYCHDGRPR